MLDYLIWISLGEERDKAKFCLNLEYLFFFYFFIYFFSLWIKLWYFCVGAQIIFFLGFGKISSKHQNLQQNC